MKDTRKAPILNIQQKSTKKSYPRLVSTDEMRWTCPEKNFKFQTTKELEPLDAIVGQPRAIEALRLGAGLSSKGYNIFVSGLSGTGRLSTVKSLLEDVTTSCPLLYDYCYVNNFEDQDSPRLIKLMRGRGKEFAKAVDDAIHNLRRSLPKHFDEESFQNSRKKIIEEYQQQEKEILDKFDEKIRPNGFLRGQIESEQGVVQPEVFPIIDGKAVHVDTLEELIEQGKLDRKKADAIRDQYQVYHNEIYDLARIGMKIMQKFRKAMNQNDKMAAQHFVDSAFQDILEHYDLDPIKIYVEEVKKYILDNLGIFVPQRNLVQQVPEQEQEVKEVDRFGIFYVNVILDNSKTDSMPVVVETTPSYTNLFGTIDRTYDPRGFWRTDFSKIKAGALLRADQGFLIVNALDLFTEPGVWGALKRVLLYDRLEIQPYEAFFQLSQLHMKPEPIDVNVKVIIIGGQTLYRMLYSYEKGFKKIFKVNAQFDYETECTDEMIQNYSRFIAKICEDENLPHCTTDGVAAIIEWAVEHAGTQQHITLKFSDVADILREAAFYDRNSGDECIRRSDVEKAIKWRRKRNDLLDEKIKLSILDGTMLIDTKGERVGQINGLTVLNDGILSFGKPARITSTISAGSAGIINIEREVEMSGPIHNKGVLIINGFFRERFASKKPLAFTASIAFEQSYSGVDGDSASAAEIYVLISSITGLPIKQNFAITGSMNQKGDIQPIGGVNEKITGYWEICREMGFTGEHAVIIPEQNVRDLMLPDEIILSVKEGNFRIYAISRIEDGTELLMGKTAGERKASGKYPKDSVFAMVEKRFEELRKSAKDEGAAKKPAKKKEKAEAKKK